MSMVTIPGVMPMQADRSTAIAFVAMRMLKRRGLLVSGLSREQLSGVATEAEKVIDGANA